MKIRSICSCCEDSVPLELLYSKTEGTHECFQCCGSRWQPAGPYQSKFHLTKWEAFVADVRSIYRHWYFARQKRLRAELLKNMGVDAE